MKRLALLVTAALALGAGAESAATDSASITTRDAGGGQIEATVTTVSTSCAPSGYCGWFAYAVERHSTLGCRDDSTFIRWVGPFYENWPGVGTPVTTDQRTFTFRPFFPRTTKLCVLLNNGAGTNVAGEATISLPAGYGAQRSSGNNCINFSSQAAAQYYFYLYPGDPSGLDGDNDGAACEANDCPCGAEWIPPEPEPPPLPVEAEIQTPMPSSACMSARAGKRRAHRGLRQAQRRLKTAGRPAVKRRLRTAAKRQRAALRRASLRAQRACR